MAQLVKNPPTMKETWVRSLGWEDSPGEGTGYPLQYPGLENSRDCIVGDHKESDRTEQLSHTFHVPGIIPGTRDSKMNKKCILSHPVQSPVVFSPDCHVCTLTRPSLQSSPSSSAQPTCSTEHCLMLECNLNLR